MYISEIKAILFMLIETLMFTEYFTRSVVWRATEMWTSCSACDIGRERRIFHCIATDSYNTSTLVSPKDCAGEVGLKSHTDGLPGGEVERACNWASCNDTSTWRASEWSDCSRNCGNSGYAQRNVDCVLVGMETDITIDREYEERYCRPEKKPQTWAPCNRFSCPGEFLEGKWEECKQNDPCKPGIQYRNLSCTSLSPDGSRLKLPLVACYKAQRHQPPIWRHCILPDISIKCDLHQPVIEKSTFNVVQMRGMRKMQLQVGQQAYVFLSTRLSIQCPVKFFQAANILWRHEHRGEFNFIGQTKNAICVDKNGRLLIRRFRKADKGLWTCYAGNKSATINLIVHQPSRGFLEWKQRSSAWYMDMLNEDPNSVSVTQSLVQWVEGTWSKCSITCGSNGFQSRTIRCERVDNRFYHILDDSECEKKLLTKPKIRRICQNPSECPSWHFRKAEPAQCTGQCAHIGVGTYKGELICQLANQILPKHKCRDYPKLGITCKNISCQVEWKAGNWSKCSKSCGYSGISARPLLCVWQHNQQSAGSLCYQHLQETPEVIRKCQPPPCVLQCVDIIPNCPRKYRMCTFAQYKYFCCKSCRNLATQLGLLGTIPETTKQEI